MDEGLAPDEQDGVALNAQGGGNDGSVVEAHASDELVPLKPRPPESEDDLEALMKSCRIPPRFRIPHNQAWAATDVNKARYPQN